MHPKTLLLTPLLLTPSAPLLAQGDLDPPGAPAPTMKSLDQVEPRTDLAETATGPTLPGEPQPSAAYVIDESGSYYLSSNLLFSNSICIEITASGVTLDLMGFTISRLPDLGGDTGSGDAIAITAADLTNITIRNGHITGDGIVDGIATEGAVFPEGVRVRGVTVTGCSGSGISVGDGSRIAHCTVRDAGDTAISGGTVVHSRGECSATSGPGHGINAAAVRHCRGRSSAGGAGILASGNVAHSQGSGVGTGPGADGIRTTSGGNVTSCKGDSSADAGIESTGNVSNSYGAGPGEGIAGVNVTNSEGVSEEGDGIRAEGTASHSTAESDGSNASDVGLECEIAIGCTVLGGEDITNKYLMP